MSPLVEFFDPATTAIADLSAWTVVYTTGQAELSGGAPPPDELAARLRAGRAGEAWRWAARVAPEAPSGEWPNCAVNPTTRGSGTCGCP